MNSPKTTNIIYRDYLTEDEHIKLVEVGNSFWLKFSALCNEHVAMMPPEVESLTEAYLQDKTSVYGRKL